jgi:hypothetical protein
MIKNHTVEDIFLSTKLDIERNIFLLKYAHETIFKADISDITEEHLTEINNMSDAFLKLRQDTDKFIENNPKIFNIEPSIKD